MQVTTRQRILSSIFTLVILVAGMMIYQSFSNSKDPSIQSFEKKDVRTVEVMNFDAASTNYQVEIDGRIKSLDQVNFFAEVTGKLTATSKRFREGVFYKKGELIFKIDDTDARFNLLALRSNLLNTITQIMPDLKFDYPQAFDQWKEYLDNYDVNNIIHTLPEIDDPQVKYYVAGKNILNQYYTIKAQEDKLSDYKIYAPFSGIVTTSNVSPGSLVSPGSNLGTFINTSRYELKAPIQLSQLKYIKKGQQVKLGSAALEKEWTGIVSRIGNLIDPTTQNLPVYISVSGKGLSEGMYLNGTIIGDRIDNVYAIPQDLVFEQNKIFIVRDSMVLKSEIQVINKSENVYFIQGVDSSDAVISSSINGVFNGQKVIVKSGKS